VFLLCFSLHQTYIALTLHDVRQVTMASSRVCCCCSYIKTKTRFTSRVAVFLFVFPSTQLQLAVAHLEYKCKSPKVVISDRELELEHRDRCRFKSQILSADCRHSFAAIICFFYILKTSIRKWTMNIVRCSTATRLNSRLFKLYTFFLFVFIAQSWYGHITRRQQREQRQPYPCSSNKTPPIAISHSLL